jgi:hypothetical protein
MVDAKLGPENFAKVLHICVRVPRFPRIAEQAKRAKVTGAVIRGPCFQCFVVSSGPGSHWHPSLDGRRIGIFGLQRCVSAPDRASSRASSRAKRGPQAIERDIMGIECTDCC